MASERKLEAWLIWLNQWLLTSRRTWLIRLYALLREFCAYLAYLPFALFRDPQQLMSHRKFIIYCQTRTGSTLLVDLLNCHPRVHCDREIFALPTIFPVRFIQTKPLIHLNKIYGCKIIGDQLEKQVGCEHMRPFVMELERNGWKIIHLVRQDSARQAISQIIMEMRGSAHLLATEKRESVRYRIDLLRIRSTREQVIKKTARDQKALKATPCLKIVYETDLLDRCGHQKTANAIFDFLGLPAASVSSRFLKITSNKLPDFVENHEEVSKFLDELNHREK